MGELVYKGIKDFGFPVVIALVLSYIVIQQQKEAKEERASHTVVLIDQISDLREKMEKCYAK